MIEHLFRQYHLYSAQNDLVSRCSNFTIILSKLYMVNQLMDHEDDADICFVDFS